MSFTEAKQSSFHIIMKHSHGELKVWSKTQPRIAYATFTISCINNRNT